MSTRSTDYREAIDQTLILHGISWEEYESILDEAGENAGMRISNDRERLQVGTLSPEHESYAELIRQVCSAFDCA